jgi:hypothetical protein
VADQGPVEPRSRPVKLGDHIIRIHGSRETCFSRFTPPKFTARCTSLRIYGPGGRLR